MKTYIYQLRHGTFNLIENDMISEIAAYTGEWSEAEVRVLMAILPRDGVVIEVGSNIGLHTVALAKYVPDGKVICFEPQRVIFQTLCGNLSLNNLTNAYAYQMGVSDVSGEMMIETAEYSQLWNYGAFSLDRGFSTENEFKGSTQKECIEVISLDEFATKYSLSRVDLLKIDAEGFDVQVLDGAAALIAKFRPFIFIEIQHDNADEIIAKMRSLGYRPFWAMSYRYQENNFKNAPFEDFGADGNLFCVPEDLAKEVLEGGTQYLGLNNLLAAMSEATSFAEWNANPVWLVSQ